MKKAILAILGIIILVIICAGFYLLGNIHAVQSMSIKRVTPDQIASAMKADNFYSNYRQSTLIVKGQVFSVSKVNNSVQVTFKTATSYGAFCDLASGTKAPIPGNTITVISNGGPAKRQTNGVLLVDCMIP